MFWEDCDVEIFRWYVSLLLPSQPRPSRQDRGFQPRDPPISRSHAVSPNGPCLLPGLPKTTSAKAGLAESCLRRLNRVKMDAPRGSALRRWS